jgi:hypothetical protein
MAGNRKMNPRCALILAILLLAGLAGPASAAEVGSGPVYSVVELTFVGPTQTPQNRPAVDVDFWVRFRHESGSVEYKVHGFWDGDGFGGTSGSVFRVRFTPTAPGRWDLIEVSSNRAELAGQKQGDFVTATLPAASHGFWIPEGPWFKRSDGTHQFIVGNTHYDFLSRPNGIEASQMSIELDILGSAQYFRKLRFCLMSPRSENASTTLMPFFDASGNQTHTETDRPNPKFFREHVDVAVQTGFELDLITDLILGGTIGDQVADFQGYMKYVAARYGAYPNVWLTLGQEYDEQATPAHEQANGNYLRSVLAYPIPMSTHSTGAWNPALNGTWNTHSIRQGRFGTIAAAADAVQADLANNQGKPAVNDEIGYDPDETPTPDVLEGIVGALAGGGYATTGHKTGFKTGGYFWGHAASGGSISEHPSADNLGFLRDKVDEHLAFWNMVPKTPAASIFPDASPLFRALEWTGNQYVLASSAAGSVTATLPPGNWQVVQLDILAKTEQLLGTSVGGSFAFSLPSSPAGLTVFKNQPVTTPPAITSFTPTSGPVGTSVTVMGSNFAGTSVVAFNGKAATFSVDSDTQLRATVPSGATTGKITVTNPAGTGTSAADFTVTAPPTQTFTFTPTDDAYVRSSTPTSNYGSAKTLRSRGGGTTIRSYLKFKVAGLTGIVQSAKLRLYVTDASPDGGTVHSASNTYAGSTTPWTQSGLKWNNAPSVGRALSSPAGTVTVGKWVEFNVKPGITGNGTHTLVVKSSSSDIVHYSSKEGANPPQLVIVTQ